MAAKADAGMSQAWKEYAESLRELLKQCGEVTAVTWLLCLSPKQWQILSTRRSVHSSSRPPNGMGPRCAIVGTQRTGFRDQAESDQAPDPCCPSLTREPRSRDVPAPGRSGKDCSWKPLLGDREPVCKVSAVRP
ncbi:hypothetical protein GCM10010376_96160 [Streptomyces violaceusniger]